MPIDPARLNALRVCGDALRDKAAIFGSGAKGIALSDVTAAADELMGLVREIEREAKEDPRIGKIVRNAEIITTLCDEIELAQGESVAEPEKSEPPDDDEKPSADPAD